MDWRENRSRSIFPRKYRRCRIWNDVRTATEIANNYEITGLDNEANLIGYWDLREPDNAQDVVPEANDRSSSNHDGTVHGPVVSLDAPGGVKKFAVTLTDSDLDNTSNTGPLLSSTIAESINTLVATQRRPRVINTTLTYSETVANDSFSDQVGTITATDLETNRSDLRFQLINGVDQSGSPLEVNGISYDYSREGNLHSQWNDLQLWDIPPQHHHRPIPLSAQ